MKKSLILIPLVLVACAVALKRPIVPVLYAQSLPATVHAHFTPLAAGVAVDQYVVIVDGTTSFTIPASACSSTDCSVPIAVATFGNHAATAAAQTFLVSGDPNSAQSGPASSAVAFVLKAAPTSTPVGVAVKQN